MSRLIGTCANLTGVAILISLAALPLPAIAQEESDHIRAYQALEDGMILPLADILSTVQTMIPGRVIDIEFEEENGEFLYELELVTADGRLLEVEVDARTGTILSQENEEGGEED